MRLSRIAMIFQSASFCTISLAARFMVHPHEDSKVFFCDMEFEQETYARIDREKIIDTGTIQTLNEELNRLVADTTDQRFVQFYDTDNGGYEYFNFPTRFRKRYDGNDLAITEYIMVIDQQGRPCSMMMSKTLVLKGIRNRRIVQRSYSLCAVGTKYSPQWRQI
ncbi:putative candidate secreted effector protein [Blumeria hordei DH14]|uniref:Putative candidate secreted effector protein n=1 Tax=Blumeria graminis f. sp. hordei (strain DH14) TaxID=546991 RepID=N1JDH3_BLUG1|nr:putative candidate secreted effector protein [Blumeria hordei DH14]